MMIRKSFKGLFAVLVLCCSTSLSWAQLNGENLVQTVPPGFKLGFNNSQDGMKMQEWIPEGETVENWSKMVTTQIFMGKGDWETGKFLNQIGQKWLSACKGSSPNTIKTGQANGYTVSMLLLYCPLNPKTGKPEATMLRAIKGGDSFYLVQKALRYRPTEDQIAQMAHYPGTVNVCDTRSIGHPCPDLKAQGFQKQ
jgi:hypothetical protein